MTSFTRRTHVVRISDAAKGEPPSSTYVDVEILDAIAFRTANGKEMVLDFASGKPDPFRVDDTGDGNARATSTGTRRTHMERITDKVSGNFFDVEVLDAVAFNDENGEEWILDLPSESSAVFDVTTGEGDSKATRRAHDEKVSSDPTDKNPSQYVTVQRTDMVAFRTINGKELIVNMASADDGGDVARASTFITPDGYDPADQNNPPPPPDPDDPHVYAFFPSGGNPLTGDAKVAQGPLWWIRNASPGGGVVIVYVLYQVNQLSSPPALAEPILLTGTPWDAPAMNIFGGPITFPTGTTPIDNPVTAPMRSKYDQWLVSTAPYRKTTKVSSTSSLQTWIIWSPNLMALLAVTGFGPFPAGPPTYEQLNQPFAPAPTLYGPGTTYLIAYDGGINYGTFPDEASATAQANSLNALEIAAGGAVRFAPLLVKSGTTTPDAYTSVGSVVFALNIAKAKTHKGPTGDPVFTFQLTNSGAPDTAWTASACAFKSSVSALPLSALNEPLFTPMGPPGNPPAPTATATDPKTGKPTSGVVAGGLPVGGVMTCTVNVKTLEVKFDHPS